MKKIELEDALRKFVPPGSESILCEWIITYKAHITITNARSSKLGDYRPPFGNKGHRISINHNLNKYAFLITLVHEIAHLQAWNKFGNRVLPHGKEWKSEFKIHMLPFLAEIGLFPDDIKAALRQYMNNPAASSCSSPDLLKSLAKYDAALKVFVDDIPLGVAFELQNGLILKKGEKRRTRYLCQDIQSKRFYLVSGVAEVTRIVK